MEETNTETLLKELEQFKKEKEKIRRVVGQIGGSGTIRQDKFLNIFFISAIIVLFLVGSSESIFGVKIPFAPLFSIELGITLVSIKIIWMIHKQTKVEHFQFWILNSLEFRLNDISKKLSEIEKKISKN